VERLNNLTDGNVDKSQDNSFSRTSLRQPPHSCCRRCHPALLVAVCRQLVPRRENAIRPLLTKENVDRLLLTDERMIDANAQK